MTKTPTTTIAIHKAVNEELKKLKKFWRETPNDVIARLIQEHKEAEAERKGLIELLGTKPK